MAYLKEAEEKVVSFICRRLFVRFHAVCLSGYRSVCPMSICLSFHWPLCHSVYPSVPFFVCLSIRPSVFRHSVCVPFQFLYPLFVFPLISQPIRLLIGFSTNSLIRLPTYHVFPNSQTKRNIYILICRTIITVIYQLSMNEAGLVNMK